jgi:hypothetical protein
MIPAMRERYSYMVQPISVAFSCIGRSEAAAPPTLSSGVVTWWNAAEPRQGRKGMDLSQNATIGKDATVKRQGKRVSALGCVLMVDHDGCVRTLLQVALCLQGYRAVAASTIEEAEDVKRRLGYAAIGLVVAEVSTAVYPRVGYTLYQHWAAAYPTLPFLLITGEPGSLTLPTSEHGPVRILAKPFSVPIFLDTVGALLGA